MQHKRSIFKSTKATKNGERKNIQIWMKWLQESFKQPKNLRIFNMNSLIKNMKYKFRS